ncbi:hypothetical protein QJQ45_013819 [Haematococcus lacustris]|nr:hypothetical protein QJQ45_013819 [Haematococcus lacustris]
MLRNLSTPNPRGVTCALPGTSRCSKLSMHGSVALRHCPSARPTHDIRCRSTASSAVAVLRAQLPRLQPLDGEYEAWHSFGDFANWLVPGWVLLGRYPYCEPSRCPSYEKGEQQLEKIISAGISTFVCLQAEVPPQEAMTLAGKNGFLPYKATAELIKAAHSPPPSMEVMMGLRNPTLNKFLPPKKPHPPSPAQAAAVAAGVGAATGPSYSLEFLHYPIEDLGVPSIDSLQPFIEQLVKRIHAGEKLYVHCWGGRGRAGTVGACLLCAAYGISADEALLRVQRAFDTRQDNKELSPETAEQREFVKTFAERLMRC